MAERIVGCERLHLLEDRRPGQGRDARDDDVPHLAAGVAVDDGDRPAGAHRRATIPPLRS